VSDFQVNSRTAGELTRRTQIAPKLLAARASPETPLGELIAPTDHLAGGKGAYRPLPNSSFITPKQQSTQYNTKYKIKTI